MSLPTERTEHFVPKEDGKIYWIENMPELLPLQGIGDDQYYGARLDEYNRLLQSAISNAVEVSNQEEVEFALWDAHSPHHGWDLELNKPYSLQCSVEKKEESSYEHVYLGQARRVVKTVALVTFSQPEREETQEELWEECLSLIDEKARDVDSYEFGLPRYEDPKGKTIKEYVMEKYTILKK